MGGIFRAVRFVAMAVATVAMGRRAWKQFQDMKRGREQGGQA